MSSARRHREDLLDSRNWPTPETSITPGWRFVSVGFEGDQVDLGGGVNPWTLDWGDSDGWIVVAHPSYPAQRHTMFVYEIANPRAIFAAGELSNGVWGFCVPETA